MIPGEIKVADGDIELNQRRKTITLAVNHSGDGRSQRLDPDAATGALPADVR
jgi:urease beta subunit